MGGWVRDRLLWDKQPETHKSQKEETEIYKILKFGVDRAYIERDTAIQKFTKKYEEPWLCKDFRTVCSAIHTSLSKFSSF